MNKVRAFCAISLLIILAAAVAAGCGGSAGITHTSGTQSSGRPKLLFITSEGWSACRIAEPIVNGLKEQFSGKVEFQTIDPDNEAFTSYLDKYDLQAIPGVVVLDSSGKVVLKETGVSDEAAYRNTLTEALQKVGQ